MVPPHYIVVFSAGNITGIFGCNYYWYGRREIILVWSAAIITGISAVIVIGICGGSYYQYCRR